MLHFLFYFWCFCIVRPIAIEFDGKFLYLLILKIKTVRPDYNSVGMY